MRGLVTTLLTWQQLKLRSNIGANLLLLVKESISFLAVNFPTQGS
jgi:hypothetical protein